MQENLQFCGGGGGVQTEDFENQAGSSLWKLVVPVGVKHEALVQTGRKVKSKRSKLRCKEADSATRAIFPQTHAGIRTN